MLIWYLSDGCEKIEGPVEVIAKGFDSYYVKAANPFTLKAIPDELVTAKLYKYSDAPLPFILKFIEENNIESVDFSLLDLFKTVH